MFDLSKFQDHIGQLPSLKTYTHLLLSFPMSDGYFQRAAAIHALYAATEALITDFPWLAAEVKHEGRAPGNSGTFRLQSCPSSRPEDLVIVRDASDLCPSYKELHAARGPCSMLPVRTLGPVVCFPEQYEDSSLQPARVFVMQANFIRGGLLLDLAAQHNSIDDMGLHQCARLLAKALRHEPFSPLELDQGNRDRRQLIPLLHDQDDGPEPVLDPSHLRHNNKSAPFSLSPNPQALRPPAQWHHFHIPAHHLAKIHDRATKDLTTHAPKLQRHQRPLAGPTAPASYISTTDTLCAFLWHHLSAARHLSPSQRTQFSRSIDARRVLGIPAAYMGQMTHTATVSLTYRDLRAMNLGETAAGLRDRRVEVDTEYAVRSWATVLAQTRDKSRIMLEGESEYDRLADVRVCSLEHAGLDSCVFGALGRPGLVRRPGSEPLEGGVHFWEGSEDGGVEMMVCLGKGEVEALRGDEGWSEVVEFVG
ncbi:uncharacterized protein BP01DRAFT_350087 [Aspergillus saccharolyticus JOP 1030-1]|uniref:Trichothecene 3-O-acetyltransferase-like N-terminal domain-containing protein n=1 Tax=Aspergillus saccharolyticus JOP 1030-1 TaxID=1450539 RepID=A0A318ZLA1_9EURO|nr:hypothetical protein BP01DRAFT_350087 [Aspergillus saccharolyticus JOP 1030-1]PYH41018.1 hypothetical protein BP01DRAFT_350087 [Aspergillus saccharolyticus JOP 1030-1]